MRLFERAPELARLRHELGLIGDSGRVVTVVGDAGAGKSSLVRAATSGRDDLRIVRGLCDPLTTPRPLGPIRELVADSGSPMRIDDQPGAGGLAETASAFVAAMATEPTVLVVEDAQWIDAASIEVLRYLVRRIDGLPLLLIVTCRSTSLGLGHPTLALIGEIARLEGSVTIELSPLSPDAVADMLAGTSLDPARVHAVSGGNPFYVSEIARHPGESLPRTVRAAVLASAAALESADLEILQLAATAPDALDDRLLPELGVDLPTLRRLEGTELLVRGRRGIRFRHELARQAVAGSVSRSVAPVLHRRLLDALEATGSHDFALLAHHAEGAADAARTRRYAALAAQEAVRTGSHTEAVAFLMRAVAHPGDDAAEHAALLEQLSTEQYMVSSLAESIASIDAALRLREQLHDADGAASAHDRRAVIEYYSARRHAAEQHVALAAGVAAGTDARDAARALQAYLAYRRSDVVAARRILHELDDAPPGERGDLTRLRIGVTAAAADLVSGSESGRAALLAHAATAFERALDELGTTAYSNLSAIDIEHRRLREAEGELAFSLPLTIERDIPICYQWQTGQRARLHLMRGRWTAADEDAGTVLREHGAPLASVHPHLVLAQLDIRHGTGEADAAGHLDAAWALVHELDEPLFILAAAAVVAERVWHTGVDDARLSGVSGLMSEAAALPGTRWAVGDLAVWLRRLGRPVPAVPVAEPYELELAGRAAGASDAWAAIGAPFESALAAVFDDDAGVAGAGLLALEDLGVTATVARARRALVERGVVRPLTVRRSTRSNPSGLTNRQLDVARLVAQGLTNAELARALFISTKTVDHHVSAILTKLGVANRRDVIRRARSLGLV